MMAETRPVTPDMALRRFIARVDDTVTEGDDEIKLLVADALLGIWGELMRMRDTIARMKC